MPNTVKIKTVESSLSVSVYLNSIEPVQTRKDAKLLAKLFKQATSAKPKMWGASIVGYGRYTYYRANGDEGEMAASGFSIRKSGPVLYGMPDYQANQSILDKLGPHKLGKSCLYLKSLEGIDLKVLARLIKAGVRDLKKTHAVTI